MRTVPLFYMLGRRSSEMDRRTHTRISKSLSYWLRHAPEAVGLSLDGEGWADVMAVLRALRSAGVPADEATLREVVSGSDKQRFELSDDVSRIRARQGHSIEVEAGWVRASPPPLLYHGTVERFLGAILSEGLLPRSRHHVHLSPDIETAKQVGSRRGMPIILEVTAGALAEEGEPFFLSANGVWLVRHVPPKHLKALSAD